MLPFWIVCTRVCVSANFQWWHAHCNDSSVSFCDIKFSFEDVQHGGSELYAHGFSSLLRYSNPFLTRVKTGDVRLIPRLFVFVSAGIFRTVLSQSNLSRLLNQTPVIINTDHNEIPQQSAMHALDMWSCKNDSSWRQKLYYADIGARLLLTINRLFL